MNCVAIYKKKVKLNGGETGKWNCMLLGTHTAA